MVIRTLVRFQPNVLAGKFWKPTPSPEMIATEKSALLKANELVVRNLIRCETNVNVVAWQYWQPMHVSELRETEQSPIRYLRKALWYASGFHKYGLYHDDVLFPYYDDVAEAIRRLPKHIKEERDWRLIRYCHLDFVNKYLPKEQWTKYEDDINFRYLTPYLDDVRREMKEKDEWEALH